jgi:hypothetical protein
MEMSWARHTSIWFRKGSIILLLLILGGFAQLNAQVQTCKIKDGKIIIELSRQLDKEAIDIFVDKYDLYDLPLKEVLQGKLIDSLKKLGWVIERSLPDLLVISKKLSGYEKAYNPADRILMTDIGRSTAERFPAVSNAVVYGYNRFRNKNSFSLVDSTVTFYLRNNLNASQVFLAGSFNDWKPGRLAMQRTDSGWIARVKLAPGKYWYKFIIDGRWTIDTDNQLTENDGQGNINSVYYRPNCVFVLRGNEKRNRVFVYGSFNRWRPRELEMIRKDDAWILPMYLLEGTHTYRFYSEGFSFTDPDNPDRFPNEFNDYNSVVRIGKPYLFRLEGFQDAQKVMLIGSFNGWRNYELKMVKKNGGWEIMYNLGPGNYEYKYIIDGREVSDPANAQQKNIPGHSGNSFFVLKPNYTFRLKGFENAKSVFLAGDFNNWSPNTFTMKKEGGEWVLQVHLMPGKRLYKFVVDGKWILDPANKLWEENEHGTGNSVLWVE